MTNNPEILIDSFFTLDPYAEEELGVDDIQKVAEEDWRKCRFVFSKLDIQPLKIEDRFGGCVTFLCTFNSGYKTRFQWAGLTLKFNAPEDIKIIDLAPRNSQQSRLVRLAIDKRGQISWEDIPHQKREENSTVYPDKIQASGIGSRLARWDFHENDRDLDGISNEHTLVLTLFGVGEVKGSLTVSARIVQSGIGGALNAFRDLILGDRKRNHEIKFTIPQIAPGDEDIKQPMVEDFPIKSNQKLTENNQEQTPSVQEAKYIININNMNGGTIGDIHRINPEYGN